jgi:hypothetical protein
MSRASTNSILQAAAKSLVWELFAAAGYGRTRATSMLRNLSVNFSPLHVSGDQHTQI